MIAPRNKLIVWTAVAAIPAALLAAAQPGLLPAALCALALLVLLAVIDAALTPGLLDGLSIRMDEVVRLTKDRAAEIVFRIGNPHPGKRLVRLGVAWPVAFESKDETKAIEVPSGPSESKLLWVCTPRQRGIFAMNALRLEMVSPFGFWDGRRDCAVKTEFRVYPNLLAERNRLAAIFLTRGGLGIHARRQIGKGREFEKLREYIPGDSYEDIHWKATARRAHPVTKVFQIERTQEVYVVVDASRLSARMVTGNADAPFVPQLDRFLQAAMVLGMVAERQGDLFGLISFSDRIHSFMRARSGRAHQNACRDALFTLQPRDVDPDYDELATFIRLRLRRRALLVFLTNLDDPVLAESFTHSMDLIRRNHLILVNMITPPGVAPLFAQPNVQSTDDVYERLGGHLQWRDLRELQRVLHRRAVRLSLLENESLTPDMVTQYLDVKQRQVL